MGASTPRTSQPTSSRGNVPYQPWAKALFDSRSNGAHGREDPTASCLPAGVPEIDASPCNENNRDLEHLPGKRLP
jgi:hypothetical protein